MAENTQYVCSVCNAVYDPETAADLSFFCHGLKLERIALPRSRPIGRRAAAAVHRLSDLAAGLSSSEPPLFDGEGQQGVMEIIPPRRNEKNAQVIEALLASMGVGQPFSIEIAADANGRRFLVRGTPATLDHIAHQIRAAYDQAECVPVSPQDDPAVLLADHLRARSPDGDSRLLVAAGRMRLRRPELFPLRTYDDLEEGDPILPLLGGFAGLRENEHVLAQIVLTPAPDNWADLYQAAAREMTPQGQKFSATGQLITALFGVGIVWGIVALVLLLALGGNLLGTIALAAVTAGVWGALLWAGQKLAASQNADPRVVKLKVGLPGFRADVRLWAAAPDAVDARKLLGRIAGAYRSFNSADGNALELTASGMPAVPQDLSWSGLLRAPVLNVRELAALWHLPVGENPDQLRLGLYQRFLPVPSTVNGEGSVLVGYAAKAGQKVPVALSPLAVCHNSLLLGKTQKGKTTLAGILAQAIMTERHHALVVIAPHRDFADGLLGLVPPDRVEDVFYVDLGSAARSVGLNLLDVSALQMAPDKIVSDLVSLGQIIWKDNWGPRMESALAYAAQTLAYANLQLKPEEQFTLLDLPYLLYPRSAFRDGVLARFVSEPDVLDWWSLYYDNSLTPSFRLEVINPVLTKIHRFSRARPVRNVIGQSRSTINVREAIAQGKILIIHTASGEVGLDVGGFLGAVMLNYLNVVVREQMAQPADARARVTVIIDEFQSIPGVDYGALLSELLKMGANFVLANQALAQLDAISPSLKGSVFSNIDTLVAFQTSGEDADYLFNELDQRVRPPDLTNLRPHECYVKTVDRRGNRLPVIHVETLAPPQGDPATASGIRERMARYTVPAAQVDVDLAAHRETWHGRSARAAQSAQRVVQALAEGRTSPDVYAEFASVVSGSGTAGQEAMTRRIP